MAVLGGDQASGNRSMIADSIPGTTADLSAGKMNGSNIAGLEGIYS